jgi:hypothetical protein
MLIHLRPESFCGESSLQNRVKVLERHLRSSSDGTIKIGEYGDWIEKAGLSVPSRQTLRLDLERYTAWCDDIVYGDGKKILMIDSHVRRDAIRYFLGEPWTDSPLKPKLSSSVCRCLLLAMVLQEEVEFPYMALPKEGRASTYKVHRGVPIRTLPGIDSGYMEIWQKDGRSFTINLARVQGRVSFTGQTTYSCTRTEATGQKILKVQSENLQDIERCADQFEGGVRKGNTILFSMPEAMTLMTADLLESWWRRTSTSPRQVERSFDVSDEKIIFSIQTKGNER